MATNEEARAPALQDDIMTFGELAEFLQLHPSMQRHSSSIFDLLRRGELRPFKLGSRWCFSRKAVNRLVGSPTRQ